MLSPIGLIHLFCFLYYHKAATTGFLFLSSLSYQQGHTNKQLSSLADSCITDWFELPYKIPFILYCEHPQHFQGNMQFLVHVFTQVYVQINKKNNSSLTVFINVAKQCCTLKPGKNTDRQVFFFLSKVELTSSSLPSTSLRFPQKYSLLPFS